LDKILPGPSLEQEASLIWSKTANLHNIMSGTRRLSLSIQNNILIASEPLAHAGSSLADFSTLKMEAISSSETSVYTISTRRHIPEDGILHSHCRKNLKSYKRDSGANKKKGDIKYILWKTY
jgi:hypothetical protein